MKGLSIVAAVSIAALGCAASAAVASDRRPVACIYNGVAHNRTIDDAKLDVLVNNNLQATNNQEKVIVQAIGAQVGQCGHSFGWNEHHQKAAYDYMRARLLYDAQREPFKAHGITFEMVEPIVAAMAAEEKQTFLGGTVTGDMLTAVITKLRAAGATIDDTAATDRTFLLALDKGIVGALTEADAEAAFASG